LRDLSIRGAGDLLGGEQAGFIASVGIELYTKMVFETMQKLKGENVEKDVSEASLLDIDTHIPLDYVSDENIRIEIHRLINEIKDLKSLNKIKSELEDRFGKITEEINIYMHEEWLEKIIQKLKIKQINQNSHNIEIILPPELSDKLDGERLFLEVYNITPKFRLKYYLKRIIISLPKKDLEKHYIYYLVDLLNMIYLQIV
ncbi:MAG: hypothetical protein PHF21_03830, partial [Bacilli bacterium]|nr:hypothetical protein [Bacilli bacterium]